MNRRRLMAAGIAALIGACTAMCATFSALAADVDYGKHGGPVKLVIGHPPHYTAIWSVHVLHGKELWRKHLPPGSTVMPEFAQQVLAERKIKSPVGAVSALPDTAFRQ